MLLWYSRFLYSEKWLMKVPYFRHEIGEVELESVRKTFQSPFLTGGPRVVEFEGAFAKFLGYPTNVVAVNSCTNALHIALKAFGVGPGDEVITTPLSFVATANAILYCGATPKFVDVDPETGLIDIDKVQLAINPKVKAVIPVHLYGNMVDMRALRGAVGDLPIIEDSAHCIDGWRQYVSDGRTEKCAPGQIGDAACFSFHALKTMTCGDGGAIAVRNPFMAEKLRRLRSHGTSRGVVERKEDYAPQEMVELGYKYNMSDIEAAILLPQLDRDVVEYKNLARWWRSGKYRINLEIADIGFVPAIGFSSTSQVNGSFSQFIILVNPGKRMAILNQIRARDVEVLVSYPAIHLMPYYRQNFGYQEGDFPNAEMIGASNIALPIYPSLTEEEQRYVIDTVVAVVKENS